MKAIALLSSVMTAGLVTADERIVNGDVISADTYPFIASLEIGSWHFCGGSLIRAEAPALVLTAAHCFENNYTRLNNSFQDLSGERMFAVFGRDDVQAPSDDQTYMNVSIAWSKVHADYGHGSNDTGNSGNAFDIAILRLDGAVEGYEAVSLFQDESCCDGDEGFTIMGYGAAYSEGPPTEEFERAYQYNVPVVECQRWMIYALINNLTNATEAAAIDFSAAEYEYLDEVAYLFVDETNICGFSTTQDTCQGDSGGPMLLSSTGEQVGIVSWGFGCASATPGVYTDVGYFRDWIMSASACLIFDPENYDQETAEACDMLCMYESIDCTHYALDIASTSEEPNPGSPTPSPTKDADLAASITSVTAMAAAVVGMLFVQ
jgi:hypothetical protein